MLLLLVLGRISSSKNPFPLNSAGTLHLQSHGLQIQNVITPSCKQKKKHQIKTASVIAARLGTTIETLKHFFFLWLSIGTVSDPKTCRFETLCNKRNNKSWYMDVSENSGTQQPWVFLLKMIVLGCLRGTTI